MILGTDGFNKILTMALLNIKHSPSSLAACVTDYWPVKMLK